MNTLDDLLNAAAADIRTAAEQVPIPSTFPDDDVRVVGHGVRTARVLVGAAAVVLVVGGVVLIQQRTDPSSVVPAEVTSTTTSTGSAATPPLELLIAPPGYADVGQIVRPAADENLRSAVFVKRNAQGDIISKVRARLGHFGTFGFGSGQPIDPPSNLPPTTPGEINIDDWARTVYVQFRLSEVQNLELESYHLDSTTDAQVADEMIAIAATLNLTTEAAISVSGVLPDGWELAVTGLEPGYATQEIFQAFEVDVPEGGNKILISNWMTTDVGIPYWEMDETLAAIEVRGHPGFVSSIIYPPPVPDAPPPPNANFATSLIWLEAPGHWVVVRGSDMTAEQLLALADQLTPSSGPWGGVEASNTTTTTMPAAEAGGEEQPSPYLGRLATFSDSDGLVVMDARAVLVEACMVELGYTSEVVGASTTVVYSENTPGLTTCGPAADEQLDFSAYHAASQVLNDADGREIAASVESDVRMIAANEQWQQCMSDAGYDFETRGDAERSTYAEGMETQSALALAKVDYGCRNNFHLVETELELRREYVATWVADHPDEMHALEVAKADLLERAEAVLATR